MYTLEEQAYHNRQFTAITEEMKELYDRKNTKYAGAFDNTLKKWGLVAAGVRIEDKVSRMSSLIMDSSNCGDETLEDTLIDLANYAVMTLKFIREQKAQASGVLQRCSQVGGLTSPPLVSPSYPPNFNQPISGVATQAYLDTTTKAR